MKHTEGTILIVDDEAQNVQVVGTMLSAFGYDFMVASDGEQALQRVRARIPDLVLLDIRMPKLDGFEVARAFRDIPGMKEVPVIFLSANDEKNVIVKALESGGVDYVTKPFSKAELLARVRTHLELKEVRDERAELLAKTERFLEVMAHDLKNWVGSARFAAELLCERDDLSEKPARIAQSISESTGQALDFITEFLTNAREARTDFEPDIREIDLELLCREVTRGFENEAKDKRITLALEFPEKPPRISSDRSALHRILENLISNAIKFSPAGSTVEVRATGAPPAIAVTDEGPGFTEDDLRDLFQPYTRLSARPTAGEVSTGLGMSIVKQLCDRLGIEIGVTTPPGGGALVSLQFPESPPS